jgi:hypothetical protein
MKKIIYTTVLFALGWSAAFSQVGIGTTTPAAGAILELKATNKALLLTRVALTSTADVTTIPSPVAGMIVYNTANTTGSTGVKANNIYRFNGTKWDFFVDQDFLTSSLVKPTILGYTPVSSSQKATVATAPGGATVTLLGCKTNPANGHVYCAYQLSAGTNFYNTFNLAKQIGGYLVTMSSNAERIWVHTNIVNSGTGYNLQNNIWIGYNKVAYPGNPTKFMWITGEDWTIDWTTSPTSTPENWFHPIEPNNNGGIEGSCHIGDSTNFPSRQWNDFTGSSASAFGVPFNQVIVEFNE